MPLLTECSRLVDADAISVHEELLGKAAFVFTTIVVERLREGIPWQHGESLSSSADLPRLHRTRDLMNSPFLMSSVDVISKAPCFVQMSTLFPADQLMLPIFNIAE